MADHRPKLKDLHPDLQALIGSTPGSFGNINATAYNLTPGVPVVVPVPALTNFIWFHCAAIASPADGGPGNHLINVAGNFIVGVYDNGVNAAVGVGAAMGPVITVASSSLGVIQITAYTAPIQPVTPGSITFLLSAGTGALTVRMMG